MQTLAITNKAFSEVVKMHCSELQLITAEKDFSFQSFLKQKMQLYRYCSTIILQRIVIAEEDELLADLVEQFLLIYDKVNLIIIYPNLESTNPELIKHFVSNDIFNIVTAANSDEQEDELEQCINGGIAATKWLQKYPELLSEQKKKAVIKPKQNIEKKQAAKTVSKSKPQQKDNSKIKLLAAVIAVLLSGSLILGVVISHKKNAVTVSVNSDNSISEGEQTDSSDSIDGIDSYNISDESSITDSIQTEQPKQTEQTDKTSKTDTADTTKTSSEKQKKTITSTSDKSDNKHSSTVHTTSSSEKETTNREISHTTKKQTTVLTTTVKHRTTSKKSTYSTTRKATTTHKSNSNTITIMPYSLSLSTGFSDNNVKLNVGDSHVISAVFLPSYTTNKEVKWESNKSYIAKIDSNGRITGVNKGVAIITATSKADSSYTAACMVTVS